MRETLIAMGAAAAFAVTVAAEAEPRAFVALANARKVAVVDVGAGTAVHTFPVGVSPHGIAPSADGRVVFVPDLLQEKTIRVVDVATGRELRQIAVDAPVHHLTRDPRGGRLYATHTVAGRLTIVALDTERVRSVEVGGAPDSAVPAPDGRTVYVSDRAGGAVAVVDPVAARVRTRILMGAGPGHGVIAADGTRAYFTLSATGEIGVIDLASRRQIATAATGPDPHGIAIGAAGRRLFVSNRGADTVTVIDVATLRVERTIPVAPGPDHLTASPDGRLILVALPGENRLAVIDAERLEVTRSIPVDGDPHQIAF